MTGQDILTLSIRYAIFHPLAYLVKLNIEMSMAHLIKKIALDRSCNSDTFVISNSHNRAMKCCTQDSDSLPPSRHTPSMLKSLFSSENPNPTLLKSEILKTEEFRVQSGRATDLEIQRSNRRSELDIYDGSSFISNNDSTAWVNSDWHDSCSASNLQGPSNTDDDIHIVRPLPAVLRPE